MCNSSPPNNDHSQRCFPSVMVGSPWERVRVGVALCGASGRPIKPETEFEAMQLFIYHFDGLGSFVSVYRISISGFFLSSVMSKGVPLAPFFYPYFWLIFLNPHFSRSQPDPPRLKMQSDWWSPGPACRLSSTKGTWDRAQAAALWCRDSEDLVW